MDYFVGSCKRSAFHCGLSRPVFLAAEVWEHTFQVEQFAVGNADFAQCAEMMCMFNWTWIFSMPCGQKDQWDPQV